MTRIGRVRCGSTPRWSTLSTRSDAARAVSASAGPCASRGRSASHARVNTARCAGSEWSDWCSVSVCTRPGGAFLPSAGFAAGSSKNLRQSSSPSASAAAASSSSSSSPPEEALFGGGGLVPSSSTHHEFSSAGFVGNVVSRSRTESRFPASWGASLCGCFETSSLGVRRQSRMHGMSLGRAHAASRKKNHRTSSCTLNQVLTKWSRTPASRVRSSSRSVLRFFVRFPRAEGGQSKSADTMRRKWETWNWGGCLLSPVRVREAERCFWRENRMSNADRYPTIYDKHAIE